MHFRGMTIIASIVLVLAIFFQLNRTDWFVRTFSSKNLFSFTTDAGVEDIEAWDDVGRDKILCVYDSTSVFSTLDNIEVSKYLRKLKKNVVSQKVFEVKDFTGYDAVLLMLDSLADSSEELLTSLDKYVAEGGTLVICGGCEPNKRILFDAGMVSPAPQLVTTTGFQVHEDALFGETNFKADGEYLTNYALPCGLTSDSKWLLSSAQGIPLLWERKYGDGKFVVINTDGYARKTGRGILIAAVSRIHDDFIYPIIASKVIFIDDFPAPVPEGTLPSIWEEFQMSTRDFFRYVWWPDMVGFARKYDLKYTGFIIETYNNHVHGDFISDTGYTSKQFLVSYGRELLKMGGELGLHGYNHQPLAPEGYNQVELDYKHWENTNKMEQALTELKNYITEVYPDYELRSYVPPSNILSPEGRATIRKVFPSVNIFCALYDGAYEERCYYQDFDRLEDGTYNIPRYSAGFVVRDDLYWKSIYLTNAYGVISHFVHPDEMYYTDEEKVSWIHFRKNFGEFAKRLQDDFPWMRASTTSEAARYMDTYFDLDYRSSYLPNGDIQFKVQGHKGQEAHFIFKTSKKIKRAQDCTLRKLGEGTYLLVTKSRKCTISFE